MGKILKYITELVYLLLSKDHMLEGVPVQAELVDVLIFFNYSRTCQYVSNVFI